MTDANYKGTERRKSELLNSSLDSMFLIDREGTILEANDIGAKRFDTTVTDLLGKCIFDYMPSDVANRRNAVWSELEKSKTTFKLVDERGGLTFETVVTPYFDDHGNLVRASIIARDITEHNEAIKALREGEHLVNKNAQMYRAVIDSAPDAIYVIDITDDNSGKFVDVNETACENLGYTREELLTMSVPDIEVGLSQYERDSNYEILDRQETSLMTGMHRRKDGTTFPISISNKTFEDGESKYAVALVRDETEWQRIENDLRLASEKAEYARQAAESANRTKSEFLASMSHELRTPLNAIIGFSDTMSEGIFGPLSEKYLEYANDINSSGKHLLELVNDILDLAKLENETTKLNIEEVPPKEIIGEIFPLVNKLMSDRRIEFVDLCDGHENVAILADKTKFKQILLNIFTNAIKYNIEGGKVFLGCEIADAGMTRITIEDTGIGIPVSLQPQLFEAFNRLGFNDTDIKGTGIGMTISKHLVELMGGRIDFESTEGKGTKFWVEIPCAVINDF